MAPIFKYPQNYPQKISASISSTLMIGAPLESQFDLLPPNSAREQDCHRQYARARVLVS